MINGSIYQVRPLYAVSFFQKVLKQLPEENAVVELNNLLATTPVLQVAAQDIESIEYRYQLRLKEVFHLNLEEFYAVYLNYCLKDAVLNGRERDELAHLQRVLHLEDQTVQNLHRKIGEIVYRKAFEAAIADGRLTNVEIEHLNRLQQALRLPKELSEKISTEIRAAFAQDYVSGVIAAQQFSPAEEQELDAIATSLNVVIQLSEQTKGRLRKLKRYWAIEHLPLQALQVEVTLQKGEDCYFTCSGVQYYEWRGGRNWFNGPCAAAGFKGIKEYYFNKAGAGVVNYSGDVMKPVDEGVLYLTNKRIVLVGGLKNSVIRLDGVLGVTPFNDGAEVRKATGKNAVLRTGEQADIFCMVLERLLNEWNGNNSY